MGVGKVEYAEMLDLILYDKYVLEPATTTTTTTSTVISLGRQDKAHVLSVDKRLVQCNATVREFGCSRGVGCNTGGGRRI